MNTIGIIGAMEEEVTQIKSKMDIISTKNIAGSDFYLGNMSGKNIVMVRCGIGKVNAAICTQILIDFYAVDCCINIGVAGAVNKELEIGDIVISKDAVYHDLDVSAFGHPIGFIPRMNIRFFEADAELIKAADSTGAEIIKNNKVLLGRIASGDQFISGPELRSKIYSDTKADCVEMEGVAIAHTCYLNMIPFVIIRSISDKADNKAESDFGEFISKAALDSSMILENMIKIL